VADVPPELTLGEVVEAVGVGVLELVAAPGGLAVPVADVVIFDPDEDFAAEPGDLVLAVGIDARRPEARELLRRAGAAGAAAVVVKVRDDAPNPQLVDGAAEAGVALLAATPDVAWGQLHAMVRTVTATAGLDRAQGGVAVGDLFALANAVAAMVGGPVTIEDPRSTVLAYSSLDGGDIDDARRATILGRRVPDEWVRRLTDDGVFRRLFREPGVVRTDYPELGIKPRLATAVRAGDEILGLIWVQEGEHPLGDDAETALVEAARVAALHLLRHRSSADLERGRRTELLRAALDGRVAPEALAPVLQVVPPIAGVTVVAFELVEPGEVAAVAVLADRAASLVTLYCESYRRQAAAVAVGPVIYLVVPLADAEDRARLPALAAGIVERAAEALHVPVRAGVGQTVPSLAGLLASRREADRVLRAMAGAGWPGPVATVDDVRSRVVLHQLQELAAADAGLRAGKLDLLVEQDRERGTEYVATLRSFFAHLGDVPAAARAQDVHANTFRYRLRRLGEVAAIDLDDPVERLVLQLQLHFLAD
jgi:hypothetical protein